jgi:hypothetical protein
LSQQQQIQGMPPVCPILAPSLFLLKPRESAKGPNLRRNCSLLNAGCFWPAILFAAQKRLTGSNSQSAFVPTAGFCSGYFGLRAAGCAATALSSTRVMPEVSNVAPAGIKVLETVVPS